MRNIVISYTPLRWYRLQRYKWYRFSDIFSSFYTLSGMVTNQMGRNVQQGDVFIFVNRLCNGMKILHMECGGLVIYHMKLESGCFKLPIFDGDTRAFQTSWQELMMMVQGVGNIPDVKTMRVLLHDLDVLGYPKVKLVTDRGFYSADNVNGLYQNHVKFLMSAGTSLSFVKKAIESVKETMSDWSRYDDKYDLYTYTQTIEWDYSQERPYKGDTQKESRRMYLHLYYNADKAVEDGRKFNLRMMDLQQDEAKSRFGFFVLLSNEIKSSRIALEIYRNKDVVEKAFGNIKERLNGKRMLVSSDASLEGKLFVEFIALIYLSYIKRQMSEKNLFKQYTLQGLLDEADLIECYTRPGKSLTVGEVHHKQRQLFKDMDVLSPDAIASL